MLPNSGKISMKFTVIQNLANFVNRLNMQETHWQCKCNDTFLYIFRLKNHQMYFVKLFQQLLPHKFVKNAQTSSTNLNLDKIEKKPKKKNSNLLKMKPSEF